MYYDENPNEFNENSNGNGEQNNYSNHTEDNQNNYYENFNGYNGASQGDNGDKKPKKKKNKKTVFITVFVALTLLLIVSLGTTMRVVFKNYKNTDIEDIINDKANVETKAYDNIGSTDVQEETDNASTSGVVVTDVSNVVEAAMPSIVAITSTTVKESSNDYYEDFFGFYFGGGDGNNRNGQTYEEQAAGSGIIVDQTDTELLLVTNNHVVEGADSLEIQFNGENSENTIKGYIKGTDANADVAVVAVKLADIPSDVLKNIKKATLGDSDSVKVGEGVIAIGNALGYGQSVTTGVISAKDRKATIEEKTMTLLQTDAAINGGNSGGALINSRGQVIGINVAKYSSSGSATSASVEGMGFAIPISSVKNIISNLETKETRTKLSDDKRGYVGITGYPVTEEISQQYGLPTGVSVTEVVKGGPADKAGIKQYDVITKMEGQSVTTVDSLNNMLSYYKAGEKVKFTIAYKNGNTIKEKDVTVTLADKSTIESFNGTR